MHSGQIRFSSFQDLDFVFEKERDGREEQVSPIPQTHLEFCMGVMRLKWIQSTHAPSVSQLILKESTQLQSYRLAKPKHSEPQTPNKPCLSSLKHEKVRMASGNKFQRQTHQSPYIKEINSLRHQIVSSFTRIELELDKSTDKSMERSIKVLPPQNKREQKSINTSINRSPNKSLKSSQIITSRTNKSPFKDSRGPRTPRKPITNISTPKTKMKQNQLQPVTIRVSIKNFSDQPPSTTAPQPRQQKFKIAHRPTFKPLKPYN